MNKILKIGGVSILAIVATTNANAAGYTCEELIEYTSCNPGYYLNSGDCIEGATCGAGHYIMGVCPENYEYFTEGCFADDSITDGDAESCNEFGTYYDAGHWCFGFNDDDTSEVVPASLECTSCAAGTYQPNAGQYSCVTCPAGSYCASDGLTAVSGVCEYGQYSSLGATACLSCPTHSYTNANGQSVTVPATTVSKGTGSITDCIIDTDTYFTDVTGTYHFKENCSFTMSTKFSVNSQADCAVVGGYWSDVSGEGDYFCLANSSSPYVPQTAEACDQAGLVWMNGRCTCSDCETECSFGWDSSGLGAVACGY